MPRVERTPQESVEYLRQLFEAKSIQRPPSTTHRATHRMDGKDNLPSLEEFRVKFLHNLRVFEQRQLALSGHGQDASCNRASALEGKDVSSAAHCIQAAHETVESKPTSNFVESSRTKSYRVTKSLSSDRLQHVYSTPCCLDDASQSMLHGGKADSNSPTSRCSGTTVLPQHETCISTTSHSNTSAHTHSASHSPNTSTAAAHRSAGGCLLTVFRSHKPVIRECRNGDRVGDKCSQNVAKHSAFRVLPSQSGLPHRKPTNNITSSSEDEPASDGLGTPPSSRTGSPEGQSQCLQPSQVWRRQSVADPRDLLQPPVRTHHRAHSLGKSCAVEVPRSGSSARVISTASIQLKKHTAPLRRKRSSSEERKISVIQTSKCFPETMTKPSSMLDEWLSSLVKQAKVQPHEEDMECDQESFRTRQHSHTKLCSPNPRHRSHQHISSTLRRHCERGVYPKRGSLPCINTKVTSEQCARPSSPSDQHTSASGRCTSEHCFQNQAKTDERCSSEETLVSQTTAREAAQGTNIAIHVTEEDSDSACVQSVSDSASVQLCVPQGEDIATNVVQHLPLSPCSSLGSYQSNMSSNADSAVDFAMPDEDTLEVEINHDGNVNVSTSGMQPAVREQGAQSQHSSSSSHTVVDSVNLPSPATPDVQPTTSTITASGSTQDLPSFLISDHSSGDWANKEQDEEVTSPDSAVMVDSSNTLELGSLPRSPSAASSSSEGSYCSTCWTDSSVSDVEMSTGNPPERKRKVRIVMEVSTVCMCLWGGCGCVGVCVF